MTTMTKQFISSAFVATMFCFSSMAELTCMVTPENENAWEVVLPGDASAYPIQWSISGDAQDFGGGVEVYFSGCNNETSIRVTNSQSGTFVPNFGSALGDRIVMLTITYETGFMQMWSFKYSISFPTETIGDISWCYMVDGGNSTIQYAYIDSTGDDISGDIAIPPTLGNYPVTAIGSYAFYNCSGLTSVTMPDSVTNIGDRAFYNCSGLTSVTIPNSVTNIGPYAFYGCSGMTNVIVNGNAPKVGDDVFAEVDSDCVVYVRRGSTGWGVDIPGTWQGMKIEYLPPVVSVECDTPTLVADDDYLTAKASLSVWLSQACDEDVTVTLTPSFEDGHTGNWADYVRFSTVESELSWLSDAKLPTVVIPAGSTGRQIIYVFALRSDEHTVGTGHGICLTPSATGADNLMCQPCVIAISANAPRIASPTAQSQRMRQGLSRRLQQASIAPRQARSLRSMSRSRILTQT